MNRRIRIHPEPRFFGWLTLRTFLLIELLLLLACLLIGNYRFTLTDDSGWCVHFDAFMVCSAQAATDYVLND